MRGDQICRAALVGSPDCSDDLFLAKASAWLAMLSRLIWRTYFRATGIRPPTEASASTTSPMSSSSNSRLSRLASRSNSTSVISALRRDLMIRFQRSTSVAARNVRGIASDDEPEELASDGRKE